MSPRNTPLTPEEEFAQIESQLAGTLKPIAPPSGLTQRLRLRIQIPDRLEIKRRLQDWKRLFLVFGGVMSGMLALITLARTLYYFVGRKA